MSGESISNLPRVSICERSSFCSVLVKPRYQLIGGGASRLRTGGTKLTLDLAFKIGANRRQNVLGQHSADYLESLFLEGAGVEEGIHGVAGSGPVVGLWKAEYLVCVQGLGLINIGGDVGINEPSIFATDAGRVGTVEP